MSKKLAYNLKTDRLTFYDVIEDGWLLKHLRNGDYKCIGRRDQFICGLVEINKFLRR